MRTPWLLVFVNVGALLAFAGVLAVLPGTALGWRLLFLFVGLLSFVNVIFWLAVRSKRIATERRDHVELGPMRNHRRGLKGLIAVFSIGFIYGTVSAIREGWDIGATIGCVVVGTFLLLAIIELQRSRRRSDVRQETKPNG